MSLTEKLKRVTESLLDDSRPAYSLRDEVLELRSVFEAAGGLRPESAGNISEGEIETACGIAISPTMAAMCVDDFARTVQFLRGLRDAIGELRGNISDRPVRIFYSGCGPWAPLAVPLMTLFSSEEVSFSLLDIHRDSIASVSTIVDTLALRDRVAAFEVADATQWTLDADRLPDLIVVEMMRAALEGEPQLSVSSHLMKQAPHAVLVPERIRLELALHKGAADAADEEMIPVGDIMLVDRTTVLDPVLEATIQVPEFDPGRFEPVIRTIVQTYGRHILKDRDAGITVPRIVSPRQLSPGDILKFTYKLGSRPHLVSERVG